MLSVKIHDQACRGCKMCIDVCPVEVFNFDEESYRAVVVTEQNCIGCLSCSYICPSGAVSHSGIQMVRNFYRDIEFCEKMGKYL